MAPFPDEASGRLVAPLVLAEMQHVGYWEAGPRLRLLNSHRTS